MDCGTKSGLALLVAILLNAQPGRDLMLPEPRTISISVVDARGTPLAEAYVDHTGSRPYEIKTDPTGRVNVSTRAPAIVIRKLDFRSERVDIRDKTTIEIVLHGSGEAKDLPVCKGEFVTLQGWSAILGFAKLPGTKVGKQSRDVDYGLASYLIRMKNGPIRIGHGSGPNWSWGFPSNEDVWGSTEYQETSRGLRRMPIIDARGTNRDGKHWRFIGLIGESASYSAASADDAKILDSFLDGCATYHGSNTAHRARSRSDTSTTVPSPATTSVETAFNTGLTPLRASE